MLLTIKSTEQFKFQRDICRYLELFNLKVMQEKQLQRPVTETDWNSSEKVIFSDVFVLYYGNLTILIC